MIVHLGRMCFWVWSLLLLREHVLQLHGRERNLLQEPGHARAHVQPHGAAHERRDLPDQAHARHL